MQGLKFWPRKLCADRKMILMPTREDSFAGNFVITQSNLVPNPDDVSFETVALDEPIVCGWHVAQLAGQTIGALLTERLCLVINGSAVGFSAALALFTFSACNIALIDLIALYRDTLLGIEGFAALPPDDNEVPNDRTVDIVINAVGNEKPGSTLVVLQSSAALSFISA
jgi:threonine dehydrogenase-like Zn-dependent dehydrogenase